jgi:septum formation protein
MPVMSSPAHPVLVLASASEARAELLRRSGLSFRIDPARIDEREVTAAALARGDDAPGVAISVALAKAKAVAARHPGALVLGADQLLLCDDIYFNKAADLGDARRVLQALRGREHQLISAAVVVRDGERLCETAATARLAMRDFSDTFLDHYLAWVGRAALGSVGCYQVEGVGVQLFERIEGDHFTILGLPLLPVLQCVRTHGVIAA